MNEQDVEQETEFAVVKKEEPKQNGEYFAVPMLDEAAVQAAEKAIDFVKRCRTAAFKVTTRHDWINQNVGGKDVPYLCESGASKVATLFGISFAEPKIEVRRFTDEMNGLVEQYICTVTARFGKREITVEGIASTDDDLFSAKGKKPFSEVDINSVRMKAYTVAQNRAIKKILGLGGITWEELAAAGIKKEESDSVNYQGRKVGSPQEANLRQRLWGMLMDLAGGDQEVAKAGCKKYSGFEKDGKTVPGFEDPLNPKVSDKWIASTYGKIKAIWEAKGFAKSRGTPHDEAPPEEAREPGMDG